EDPQLRRAEAPPQRDGPFAVVDDALAAVGLEKLRLDRERAHQAGGVAHEMRRAVELRAEPLVRVQHQAVDTLDALPQRAELRTDHRRAGPGGSDMDVEAGTT